MQRTSLGQEQGMCQKALILSNCFVQGMLLKSLIYLFSLAHIFSLSFSRDILFHCAVHFGPGRALDPTWYFRMGIVTNEGLACCSSFPFAMLAAEHHLCWSQAW